MAQPDLQPEIRASADAGALTLTEWEQKMGDGRNLVRARARRTSQGPAMALPVVRNFLDERDWENIRLEDGLAFCAALLRGPLMASRMAGGAT